MKHTPGPWKHEYRMVRTVEGDHIASVTRGCGCCEDDPSEQDLANAQLIALAPEMLEALKLASDAWDTSSAKRSQAAWKAMQAVIRKAEEGQ